MYDYTLFDSGLQLYASITQSSRECSLRKYRMEISARFRASILCMIDVCSSTKKKVEKKNSALSELPLKAAYRLQRKMSKQSSFHLKRMIATI